MRDHPVAELRGVLETEFQVGLPVGVYPVPEWVADPQFFPGASGLLTEEAWADVAPGQSGTFVDLPKARTGGVLVMGNYFAGLATYERVRSGELKGLKRTWGRLGRLLVATHPREVFLTNSYIGIADVTKDNDTFPTNPEFDQRCASFLRQEIELLAPRAVVCLGLAATRMLARAVPDQLKPWSDSTLGQLADRGQRIVHACTVTNDEFTAAATYHPSYAMSNMLLDEQAQLVAKAVGHNVPRADVAAMPRRALGSRCTKRSDC